LLPSKRTPVASLLLGILLRRAATFVSVLLLGLRFLIAANTEARAICMLLPATLPRRSVER